ncbi:hypothetical protein [Elizabethkingia meningoseptica]
MHRAEKFYSAVFGFSFY